MSFQVKQEASHLESDLLSPVVSFEPKNIRSCEWSLINFRLYNIGTVVLRYGYFSTAGGGWGNA